MTEEAPQIDIHAIEGQAQLAMALSMFTSKFLIARNLLVILGGLLYLLFIILIIYVLVDSDDDCGFSGSVRGILIGYLVMFLCTLIFIGVFETLFRRGAVLKCPQLIKIYAYLLLVLFLFMIIILIASTIVTLGDGDCSDDFYPGFALALTFIILFYFILLVSIVTAIIVYARLRLMKKHFESQI